MEKTMVVKPYDRDVSDDVFSCLFRTNVSRPDGLTEIPAASIQIVISALELLLWDCNGKDERIAVRKCIGIINRLREEQKDREWNRRKENK